MRGQSGSVVKKGSSYFIKYRQPDGKQKMSGSRPGHGFKTYEEAQGRLHEVLNDINKGDYVEPKKITFQAFAEEWIEGRLSIGGSTRSAYDSIIREHLIPKLGSLRVHEIQFEVQAFAKDLTHNVSTKTLHNVITLLRTMLVGKKGPSAIKLGYIRHDPTKGLELPRVSRQNIQPPTPEHVWKLIDSARASASSSMRAQVAHAAIFLDAFTGLRRGEMLALKFSDIDWFAREIIVSRSVSKAQSDDGVHKWTWELGTTKNGRTRRVGVGEKVLRFLIGLKQHATDKEGFVLTPQAAGLTACRYDFLDPDTFDELIYGPIVTNTGLGRIRFHDLRHFFASMLIAQGESAKYVCDQLGHRSVQFTFDVYGHLFPQAKQAASSKLEDVMFSHRQDAPVEEPVEKAISQLPTTPNARGPN